jgi:hypothetical protein
MLQKKEQAEKKRERGNIILARLKSLRVEPREEKI